MNKSPSASSRQPTPIVSSTAAPFGIPKPGGSLRQMMEDGPRERAGAMTVTPDGIVPGLSPSPDPDPARRQSGSKTTTQPAYRSGPVQNQYLNYVQSGYGSHAGPGATAYPPYYQPTQQQAYGSELPYYPQPPVRSHPQAYGPGPRPNYGQVVPYPATYQSGQYQQSTYVHV